MDWLKEIEDAGKRIAGHIRVTPVMQADLPGAGGVALKVEHMQHTGHFKAPEASHTPRPVRAPAAGQPVPERPHAGGPPPLAPAAGRTHCPRSAGRAAGRLGAP